MQSGILSRLRGGLSHMKRYRTNARLFLLPHPCGEGWGGGSVLMAEPHNCWACDGRAPLPAGTHQRLRCDPDHSCDCLRDEAALARLRLGAGSPAWVWVRQSLANAIGWNESGHDSGLEELPGPRRTRPRHCGWIKLWEQRTVAFPAWPPPTDSGRASFRTGTTPGHRSPLANHSS